MKTLTFRDPSWFIAWKTCQIRYNQGVFFRFKTGRKKNGRIFFWTKKTGRIFFQNRANFLAKKHFFRACGALFQYNYIFLYPLRDLHRRRRIFLCFLHPKQAFQSIFLPIERLENLRNFINPKNFIGVDLYRSPHRWVPLYHALSAKNCFHTII